MMRKTFIPNWYVDEKNEIRNKKIRICIVVTSLINIFLISLIFNTSNKLKNINGGTSNQKNNISIEEKNKNEEKVKNEENIKHNIITIEKYKELSSFFEENNFSYMNIIITESNMEIDIGAKSYEEYITQIRCIENHYSIKELIPNTKNEGNFNFKVILEV